ncbi:MAG: hypothetical protein Q4G71_12050 [Pseudomonadota bacterium]|nr:hypothetical protein [Pseudomonadota bacterium]
MHTQPTSRDDEEYTMPCVEALLAGTLALMTGFAQGSAHAGPMASKIVANLDALADHPALSEPMRLMLARLVPRWQPQAKCDAQGAAACSDRALWLRSPVRLQ